jgi:hypothetical protein
MDRLFARRPSPAMVVAFVALLAALSGTAVALPGKNTVDSGDIKKANVKKSDIAKNAVISGKVKDGSLLAKDFKAGELPAGPQGTPGAPGAKGDKGDPGDAGTAVAYATVAATGTVDLGRSKNITQANVDVDTETGVYCFTNLEFTPRSAMVAAQPVFNGGDQDVIASVYMAPISVSQGDCFGKLLVRTFDISEGAAGALADRAFQIWFED